jgi:hypothetical protein
MKNLVLLFFIFISLQNYSQTYNLSELEGKELHNSCSVSQRYCF